MLRCDLQFSSEFSPAQINLPVLLELAYKHGAECRSFNATIHDRNCTVHANSDYGKRKLVKNNKLSLHSYDLVEAKDTILINTGTTLCALLEVVHAMCETFARHILKTRHGMKFVPCIL